MAKKAKKKATRKRLTEEEKKDRLRSKRKLIEASFAALGADSPYFYSWLKQNVLRRAFRRWPAYYLLFQAKDSKLEYRKDKRGVMRKMRTWQCAECGGWFVRRDLVGDHIQRVGSNPTTPEEIGQMVVGLYCRLKNMQRLCDYKLQDERFNRPSCHYVKTQEERATSGKTSPKARKGKKK